MTAASPEPTAQSRATEVPSGLWDPSVEAAPPLDRKRTLARIATQFWGPGMMLLDILIAWTSMAMGYLLSPSFHSTGFFDVVTTPLIFSASFLLLAYAAGLYDRRLMGHPWQVIGRVGVVAPLSALLTVGIFLLLFFNMMGRWVLVINILFSALGATILRLLLVHMLRSTPRRVLLVGDSAIQSRIREVLDDGFDTFYEVVGVWLPEAPANVTDNPQRSHCTGELHEVCQRLTIDELVLPMDTEQLDRTFRSAMRCLPSGCQVHTAADMLEKLLHRVPTNDVPSWWVLGKGWNASDHIGLTIKRFSDIGMAILGLVLSLPIVVLIAPLLKLTSAGPLFYTQTRVGKFGQEFTIFKFRTMTVDAETDGAKWASTGDSRTTSLGRYLRKTRIDELPQLVNILLGDMSFVGPRPERPEFTIDLERKLSFYACRHMVRPGLTGWAQINYRYGASVEDARHKLEYDLFYVRHASPVLDFAIVLKTVMAVMKGAR